jgi:hypothetical protein
VGACQTETISNQLSEADLVHGTVNSELEGDLGSVPYKQSGNASELVDWIEAPDEHGRT